ncbi:MAG TPA: 8-amino-7-oxononanoate synthase [Alphaproteobacteria bacterium]|nr:8-amino-7-oxononanoate synthase [Alphaproteobacteria bacterium]
MSRFDHLLARRLDSLSERHRLRSLRPVAPRGPGKVTRDGKLLVNFSSNDYLGLAAHPALIARAREWAEALGTGSSASRLVCGTLEAHERIEAKVAAFKGTEAALIFASGFQANATVLPALLDRRTTEAAPLVFADALIHASLHHGCRAAGVSPLFFRHNDLAHLEELLAATGGEPAARFILTESVFSMDGDHADVPALAALARRYDAFLYLDEAHATGVLGERGAGLASLAQGEVDLVMGTFSKALGSFGAYVAGSRTLRDYLINRCAGFIYSTALPPPVLGAIDAALDLVPRMEAERAELQRLAARLRTALRAAGLDTGASTTHIVPVLTGEEAPTMALAAALEERGLLGVAIRPPTVPVGASRIRFALTAAHQADDVDRLVATLTRAARPAPAIHG